MHGFLPTNNAVSDPNNDIDGDHNFSSRIQNDFFSGIITITEGGEPLNDGDPEDCWFDNDTSGNMTIDFGFFDPSLYVWGGDIDSDWATAGNWIGGSVPTVTSEVVIPPQRPNYPIVNENVQIQKIEVQVGACLEVLEGFSFDVLCP